MAKTIMFGSVLSRFLAAVPFEVEGYCSFWFALAVDDTSEHHAGISLGREYDGCECRRDERLQNAEGGISCYSESAFSGC